MPSSQLTTRTQLETERNNFLLHEQRIIQERDEILRNIHNHLEQLDAEIVRLGGTARDTSSSATNNIPVEYTTSIAPFPAIESNESTTTTTRKHKNWSNGTKVVACKACRAAKKKCTHNGNNKSRSSENNTAEKAEEKIVEKCKPAPKDSSSGDEKKQSVATSLSFNTDDMKENESNNSRSSSGSEFSLTTTTEQPKKKKKEKTQVPRQRLSKSGLTPAEIHNGKPWDCECGEHLPGDRARCGKCKKWKGGVRPPNQTSTTATTKPKAEKKKKKVVTVPLPTVNDIYRNVSDKSADDFTMDGALILASLGSGSYYNDTNRPAVERCLGDIVSAVTSHVEAQQAEMKKKTTKGTKKRGRPRKDSGGATATRKGEKSDGTVTVKRKRGRPKKVVAEQPQIQRVVSKESDSNNGSITSKPERPKSENTATSASAAEQSHMMIDMADLKLTAPSSEDEKEKTKRRKTNPEEVVEATKIVACIVTLAEAAASGCSKCRDELATGEKTRREHSDHCPRKRRSSSSSSSSGQSSKSTSSSTSTRSAVRSAVV